MYIFPCKKIKQCIMTCACCETKTADAVLRALVSDSAKLKMQAHVCQEKSYIAH